MKIDSLLNLNTGAEQISIPESVQLPPPQPHAHQQSHVYQPGAASYQQNQTQDLSAQSGPSRNGSIWESKNEGFSAAYPSPSQSAYAQPETQYRERTGSTMTIRSAYRGSFSGPTTNSSLPESRAQEHERPDDHGLRRFSHYTIPSTEFKGTSRPEQQPQSLPPLISLAEPRPPLPTPRPEGAISPRTVAGPHQQGSQSSYFPPSPPQTSHHNYYRHHSQQNNYPTSPVLPLPHAGNAAHNAGSSEVLMRFADVAVEQRAADDRRSVDAGGVRAERREPVRRRDSGNEHGEYYQRMPSIGSRMGFSIDPSLTSGDGSAQDARHGAHPGASSLPGLATHADPTVDTPLFHQTPHPSQPTSPVTTIFSADGSTDISSDVHELSQPPSCSYCAQCTTNSPLRKVVSHIFGRNKLSTRQIPKNVWVYYCRKHYQRSRYRNPRGFARQQVLLVKRQCQRLQKWGGVKDWVIKVRRREEIRMSREHGQPCENDDFSADSGDENSRLSALRRNSESANWILQYTGPGKTIDDVYKLLEVIQDQVQNKGLVKFPDVELLPNVDLALAIPLEDGGEGNSLENQSSPPENQSSKSRKRRSTEKDDAPISYEAKRLRLTRPHSLNTPQHPPPMLPSLPAPYTMQPTRPLYQPLHLHRRDSWYEYPNTYSSHFGGHEIGSLDNGARRPMIPGPAVLAGDGYRR